MATKGSDHLEQDIAVRGLLMWVTRISKSEFDICCVFFFPPEPSTSKTNLDVSEDRREDQLSPDDPERLEQQQLVCGEAPDTNVSVSL